MASLPLLTAHPSLPRPRTTKPFARIKKPLIHSSLKKLKPLYDDGYTTAKGIKEFHDVVSDLLRFNKGPPRWFCPADCGPPVEGSPVLLFLPGLDGIGMGLFMHHKALGRIFEVRCMHVPFSDRTTLEARKLDPNKEISYLLEAINSSCKLAWPFLISMVNELELNLRLVDPYSPQCGAEISAGTEIFKCFIGLILFVEDVVRLEHSSSQNRPIYLLGHSFGGCLALSVAARNPHIDLIVILTNPATSSGKSKWQPLFPVLRSSFGQLISAILFLIFLIDNQVKWGFQSTSALAPFQSFDVLSRNIVSPVINLSHLMGKISDETISWKLKLLESAASHANSRLHAIKAEVLVIASCLDTFLPSREEGEKLAKLLYKCKVYYFENLGHNIIVENSFHLCSIIKSSGLYRRARQHDYIEDFPPTTITELHGAYRMLKTFYLVTSPVMFSTTEDGRIVRGLSGVPNDGPVLLVGNHMLLGIDMMPLITEFLREKRTVLRGMAHPALFNDRRECSFEGHHFYDYVRLCGAVPVTDRNLYRLLSEKSFVLLYPGGSREALHRKGEVYKLFWPAKPEFVRMAANFGAKIVPFASVGEDDIVEMLLDYNDLMSIPFVRESIAGANRDIKLRNDKSGVRDEDLLIPVVRPKIPGRYYYLFGKPISMIEKAEVMKEREAAKAIYLHIKSEVENLISYLLKKREEDAYRSIFQRSIYRATRGSSHKVPSFEP